MKFAFQTLFLKPAPALAQSLVRVCSTLAGTALVSMLALGPLWTQGSVAILIGGLLACDLLGLWLITWGTGSLSAAAIIASVVNAVFVVYIGQAEAGSWAGGLVLLKYPVYLIAALAALKRERRPIRWLGVILPAAALAYMPLTLGVLLLIRLFRRG